MSNKEFLIIDGALGEGGGSILRLSSGFSILYNRSIKIRNIRANRPEPGLKLQHLLGLKTLSEVTGSFLSDCKVGTEELTFIPKHNLKTNISLEVSTAANLGLLLQPIQIASMNFKAEKVELTLNGGGTFGLYAPSLNYLKEVTYKIFSKSGLNIDIDIKKHGFYPKSFDSHVKCTIYPPKENLKPVKLTELGRIDLINGEIIITSQLKGQGGNIGERIKRAIEQQLKKEVKIETDIQYKWVDAISPGVGLSLWAHSNTGAILSTGTLLGEKGLSSEKLGTMAANELIKYIKNEIPVDNYLSDQLIPLMAFVNQPSKIKVLEITNHTKTNLEIVKMFTNRNYEITKEKNYFIIEYH